MYTTLLCAIVIKPMYICNAQRSHQTYESNLIWVSNVCIVQFGCFLIRNMSVSSHIAYSIGPNFGWYCGQATILNWRGPPRPVTVWCTYAAWWAKRLSQIIKGWSSAPAIPCCSIFVQTLLQKSQKIFVVVPVPWKHWTQRQGRYTLPRTLGGRVGSPGSIANMTFIFAPKW